MADDTITASTKKLNRTRKATTTKLCSTSSRTISSTTIAAIGPEEIALLVAYREMGPEYGRQFLRGAQLLATKKRNTRPTLRLVSIGIANPPRDGA